MAGADVTVSFTNMAGGSTDWISVAQAGSADTFYFNNTYVKQAEVDWISIADAGTSDTTIVRYQYTGGGLGGTITFSGLGNGTYVARAYFNNSYTKQAQSASFTIGGSLGPVMISTDKTAYAAGADVVVTYSGMSGSTTDWIAIAQSGSLDTDYVLYRFTGGSASGTMTFSGLAVGSYVARAFFNNTFTKQAETPAFTVGP